VKNALKILIQLIKSFFLILTKKNIKKVCKKYYKKGIALNKN